MATIDVFDIKKTKVSEMEISDAVFGAEVREYLMHEAVKIQLANRRAGTVAVKNRSAVSGGGKKPFQAEGNRSEPVREPSGRPSILAVAWPSAHVPKHTIFP